MKHQWLDDLGEFEPLNPEIVASWQDVEGSFRAAGMVKPAPGFVQRWHIRLEKEQSLQSRRQAWFIVGLNIVIAGILLFLSLLDIWPIFSNPSTLLLQWTDSITQILGFMQVVYHVSESMVTTLPRLIPSTWLMTLTASVVGIMVLWASTLKQYMFDQGVLS